MKGFPLFLLSFLLWINGLPADDWPGWRGSKGDGTGAKGKFPIHWSPEQNLVWKKPLPEPGNSTPIVVGEKIFLTQAQEKGTIRTLLAIDRKTGKILWEKSIEYLHQEPTHKTNPYCSASPVSNGKIVVVSHGSAGVYAYDLNGQEIWKRTDLGAQRHIWGNASSPAHFDNSFIQYWGPGPNVYLIALRAEDGQTIWKKELPDATGKDEKHWFGSWSTPVLRKNGGRKELLIGLPQKLCAFSPKSGELIWWCEGLGDLVYNNPAYSGDLVLATSGYGGPALAVKAGTSANGDLTGKRLWLTQKRNPQRIGSGVFFKNHFYILNEPGIFQCIHPETGEIIKEARVGKGGNWGSLSLVNGFIYVTNLAGQTLVLSAEPDFRVLATNEVNERTLASLAFSDGQVFLRTYSTLWCFGERNIKD